MTDTTTPASEIARNPTGASYVEWSAIFAGAILASAITVLMTAFGSAIGLSLVSPLSRPLARHFLRRSGAVVHLDYGLQFRRGRLRHRAFAPTDRWRDGA
jgi:hypothetical protein